MTARMRLGALGEDAAAGLLEKAGYKVLKRNHRCRLGEVDLIAEQGALLVFVEVRTRATAAFGAPAATVSPAKQRKVITAARDFLARWRGPERGVRFDVISVVDAPGGPVLEHIPAAFEAF